MTLREQMAADVTDVFLSTDDFAVAGKIYADGAGDGLPVTLMPGEPVAEVESEADLGLIIHRRQQQFLGALAALRTALSARNPRRGDTLGAMTDQGLAGTWTILRVVIDDADGCTMHCVLAEPAEVLAEGGA
jgi:hypothetical protein